MIIVQLRLIFWMIGLPALHSFCWNLKTMPVNVVVAVTDETLYNFYTSYKWDFNVYIKDKLENYGLLLWLLADSQDRLASRIILYVTLPINNPKKRNYS